MWIILAVCLKTITYLQGTFLNKIIPFDKNIAAHISISWSIVFWSVVHCVAHYFNFDKAKGMGNPIILSLTTGVGVTGLILCVVIFLMVTSATEAVRKICHEIFIVTHTLVVVFFGIEGLMIRSGFNARIILFRSIG
jgi:hypothetical protein